MACSRYLRAFQSEESAAAGRRARKIEAGWATNSHYSSQRLDHKHRNYTANHTCTEAAASGATTNSDKGTRSKAHSNDTTRRNTITINGVEHHRIVDRGGD